MPSTDELTSGFGTDSSESNFGLNRYSQLTQLPSSGSTCDTFTARRHNRTVFIKRLKPQLRSAACERAAFAKEFELGITLSHPSLPVYRDLADDFIVIDYVDGLTLADMMAAGDPWLKDPANIRKMLRQLVEVVAYLHHRNVIHSDIKTDNVMLTHGTRNLMLIDLDKAYTYTHDSTAGAPSNYGLEPTDIGNPAIDFLGIARIVRRLAEAGYPTGRLGGFERMCRRPGITAEALLHDLDRRHLPAAVYWAAGLAAVALASATLYLWIDRSPAEAVGVAAADQATLPADTTLRADTAAVAAAGAEASSPSAQGAERIPAAAPDEAAPPAEESATYVWAPLPDDTPPSAAARAKVVAAQEITRVVDALYCHLDDLSKLRRDTTLTSSQLLSALRAFVGREEQYFGSVKRSIRAEQPDITAEELYVLVYNSPRAMEYIRQSNLVQQRVGEEFRRRYILEHGHEPPRIIPQ